jgi:hypothetical protein
LVEEVIEWVSAFPDRLEVAVSGAAPRNVLGSEVG